MSQSRVVQTKPPVQISPSLGSGMLQRKCSCGNHSPGGRLCTPCRLQKKQGLPSQNSIKLSQENDRSEQEADQMAGKIMKMSDPVNPQQKEKLSKGDEALQLKALRFPTTQVNTSPAIRETLRRDGHPLEADTRSFMESRFGYDFSHVRVHRDSKAASTAMSLNAKAFTYGRNLVFGERQYQPGSAAGRELIAHELTHVVQQGRDREAGVVNRSAEKIHKIETPLVQRVSWDVDEGQCEIKGTFEAGFNFLPTRTHGWTSERSATFISRAKQIIENTFNGNTFGLLPTSSRETTNIVQDALEVLGVDYSCPCQTNGFHPTVELNARDMSVTQRADDWNVHVSANPEGEFRRSNSPAEETGENFGRLDEADVTSNGNQVAVVHEFGHSLGLQHPGHNISGVSNEYEYTGPDENGRTVDGPVDLMGEGMGLRPFYFQRWVNALNNQYDDCGYRT